MNYLTLKAQLLGVHQIVFDKVVELCGQYCAENENPTLQGIDEFVQGCLKEQGHDWYNRIEIFELVSTYLNFKREGVIY